MALRSFSLGCILLLVFLGVASSSSYLSARIFDSQGKTGRSLLQALSKCPVDFEHQNYTIITSQCKGPQYRADLCCEAFKEFSCPFVDQINNLQSDCSFVMFSYINLYGKYPPGLFANMCNEGEKGLECADKNTKSNSAHTLSVSSPSTLTSMMMISTGFLVMMFQT